MHITLLFYINAQQVFDYISSSVRHSDRGGIFTTKQAKTREKKRIFMNIDYREGRSKGLLTSQSQSIRVSCDGREHKLSFTASDRFMEEIKGVKCSL